MMNLADIVFRCNLKSDSSAVDGDFCDLKHFYSNLIRHILVESTTIQI